MRRLSAMLRQIGLLSFAMVFIGLVIRVCGFIRKWFCVSFSLNLANKNRQFQ